MQTLADWARETLRNFEANFLPRVDARILSQVIEKEEKRKVAFIALKAMACIDENPKYRPTAKELKDFFDNL